MNFKSYFTPAVDNVLQFGTVNFHDTEYVPHRIDKKKLIIENVDDKLEKDVLCLYADNLLQDIDGVEFNIVNLRNRCIMLFFNKEYSNILKLKFFHASFLKLFFKSNRYWQYKTPVQKTWHYSKKKAKAAFSSKNKIKWRFVVELEWIT